MSQNSMTHFKNLAANATEFWSVSDDFGTLCIKGLRWWACLSILILVGPLTLLTAKTVLKELDPRFVPWSFFPPLSLLFISINLPYDLSWDTVAISGLVLLAAIWICLVNCRNGYLGPAHCLSRILGSLSKCGQFKSFL